MQLKLSALDAQVWEEIRRDTCTSSITAAARAIAAMYKASPEFRKRVAQYAEITRVTKEGRMPE